MERPPVALCYPTYVIEYAVVDDAVKYMNRRNLNVGGEWLGAVPKLAICRDIEKDGYCLAHCNDKWDVLCAVETRETIEEVKATAEKHYHGIGEKWMATGYKKSDAVKIYEQEKDEMRCSFCGRSHYSSSFTGLIKGKGANICNICVQEFGKEINENGS